MVTRAATFIFAVITTATALPLVDALTVVGARWVEHQFSTVFLWGAISGILLGIFIWKCCPILMILEHEITHLVTALCLFRKPLRVVADHTGGELIYEGRGSTIICLAPYFLPTFTFVGLGLQQFADPNLMRVAILCVSITWGYHFVTGIIEAHPRQTDISRGGYISSYVAIISTTLIMYPLTALATVGGWSLVSDWFRLGWQSIF